MKKDRSLLYWLSLNHKTARKRERSDGLYYVLVLAMIAGAIHFDKLAEAQKTSNSIHHHVTMDGSLAHEYNSLGELKGASTYIVVSTVTSQKTETLSSHGEKIPSTFSTVKVESTLLNKSIGRTNIVVRQYGGTNSSGDIYDVKDFPLLKMNTRYVLFLTPSPDPNIFYPVGAYQGVFVASNQNSIKPLNGEFHSQMSVNLSSLEAFAQQIKQTPSLNAQP